MNAGTAFVEGVKAVHGTHVRHLTAECAQAGIGGTAKEQLSRCLLHDRPHRQLMPGLRLWRGAVRVVPRTLWSVENLVHFKCMHVSTSDTQEHEGYWPVVNNPDDCILWDAAPLISSWVTTFSSRPPTLWP